MRNVILVGRRPDRGRRDEIWAWCRARWQEQAPSWEIFEGAHKGPGPFSLAAATNDAARRAGPWDGALIVGGEHFAHHFGQIHEAIGRAHGKRKLVFAHDHLTLLSEEESDRIMAGGEIESAETRHPNTFSGVLVVTREIWETVHGFDERFQGWGWEDLAFWSSCCAMFGGFERVRGDIYHLWHPTDRAEREESPTHGANQVLGERYLAAKANATEMRQIILERLEWEKQIGGSYG